MNASQLQVLNIITDEYKAKSYDDLNKIENNEVKFYYKYENQTCWIEIFIDKKLKDIVRVMISVELDNNWMAKAKYFGKTKDGKIIESDDMIF